MIFSAVGDGIIRGADGFVWAAYGISWLIILLYTIMLVFREKRENVLSEGGSHDRSKA